MSVLLAIIGPDSAVVATDGRRTEGDGSFRDDYDKTFQLPGVRVVGGHSGLLEFSGQTVPLWISTLPLTSYTRLSTLADEVLRMLVEKLTSIPDDGIKFEQRRLDVFLVGKPNMKSGRGMIEVVEIHPDAVQRTFTTKRKKFAAFCTSGDDLASKATLTAMEAFKPYPSTLPRSRLAPAVRSFIKVGVDNSGLHPSFPDHSSCGGPAMLRLL